jgi:hypothetical protein
MGGEGMVVFDAASGKVLRFFDLPPGVHNFVFNADGTSIYEFRISGEIIRIRPDTGAIAARVTLASPRGLGWTADRRHLVVGGKNELFLLDPDGLSVVSRFGGLGVGQVFYPAATRDGRWILAPAVLDGVVLAVEAATGKVAHRIQTGSPLQVALDGKIAWVSNVLVPPELLPPNAQPRSGGIGLLDLETLRFTPVAGVPDANGIALAHPQE